MVVVVVVVVVGGGGGGGDKDDGYHWKILTLVYIRVANLLKREYNRKKSQSPHPGNTFITIKDIIYNMKSINVKLDAASVH